MRATYWFVGVLVVVLIVWNLVTGLTLQKLSLFGIAEMEFGQPPGPVDVQNPDYSNKEGVYKGKGKNKTYHIKDEVTLDLRSIDEDSGNVDAYVVFSPDARDRSTRGNLSGTIAEDATMDLSGDVQLGSSEYIDDADFDCRFTHPEAIECTWKLNPRAGNPYGAQEGDLVVRKS
jgi:hypothetical protein